MCILTPFFLPIFPNLTSGILPCMERKKFYKVCTTNTISLKLKSGPFLSLTDLISSILRYFGSAVLMYHIGTMSSSNVIINVNEIIFCEE